MKKGLVYFHEQLGKIVEYKVTDGFFSDITEGTQLIESEAPPCNQKGCHHRSRK